jgi:thymidylate kinase
MKFITLKSRGGDYRERVRQGFLAEAKRHPGEIQIINAARSIDVVQNDIRRAAAGIMR